MNNISHTHFKLIYHIEDSKFFWLYSECLVIRGWHHLNATKCQNFLKIWFQLYNPAYCLSSRVFGSLLLTWNNLIINWHHSKLSEKLFFVLVKFTAAPIFTLLLLRWIPPNLPIGFEEKRNRYKQTNKFVLSHHCVWISAILSLIVHP